MRVSWELFSLSSAGCLFSPESKKNRVYLDIAFPLSKAFFFLAANAESDPYPDISINKSGISAPEVPYLVGLKQKERISKGWFV